MSKALVIIGIIVLISASVVGYLTKGEEIIETVNNLIASISFSKSPMPTPPIIIVTTTTTTIQPQVSTTIQQTVTTTTIYQQPTTTTTVFVCPDPEAFAESGSIVGSVENLGNYPVLDYTCEYNKCVLRLDGIDQRGGCGYNGVKITKGSEKIELTCKIVHNCDSGDSCHKSIPVQTLELSRGEKADILCCYTHTTPQCVWNKENCGWFDIGSWGGPSSGGVKFDIEYFNYGCKQSSGVTTTTIQSQVTTTTISGQTTTTIPSGDNIGFSLLYDNQRAIFGIGNEYLIETEYYDYSAPAIQAKILSIMSQCSGDIEKCIKSAQQDAQKMGYCVGTACFKCPQKGSQTLADGNGICSTKSQYLTTLLRGMGIASRMATGRARSMMGCAPLFSLFSIDFPRPISGEMDGLTNDISQLGEVDHAWVEAWLPEKGWFILETTPMGYTIVDQNCIGYKKWATIVNGEYRDIPLGSDSGLLDNECWSNALRKTVPCLDWAKEGCWVPDEWDGNR